MQNQENGRPCDTEQTQAAPQPSFMEELTATLKRHGRENGSHTPDFLLASLLSKTLNVWDEIVAARDRWYGDDWWQKGAASKPLPERDVGFALHSPDGEAEQPLPDRPGAGNFFGELAAVNASLHNRIRELESVTKGYAQTIDMLRGTIDAQENAISRQAKALAHLRGVIDDTRGALRGAVAKLDQLI